MAARRLLIAGLIAGAAIRVIALPQPGTGDMTIWKVWSFAATYDVTAMYGVGGVPPERRLLHWHGEEMTVDYPPLALYELAVVGHLYRWVSPTFDDSRTLNVFLKLPGLAAEIGLVALIIVLGRRRLADADVTWAVLAVWLNPAILIDGPVLGYLDAQMAVPLVGAVLAACTDRPGLAGALVAIAVLTKAQAVFALPVIVALVLWRSLPRWMPVVRTLSAGAFVGAISVLPYALRGAWSNLTQAVGRLGTHDMLSAQAPNVWWIFTWALRVQDVWQEWGWRRALMQETRILAISRAIDLGYPNARALGLALVGAALLWACLRARRIARLADAFALAAWCMYAYGLFAAQVHENHLYAVVPLLAAAAALGKPYRAIFWLLSGIVATNLYVFYGFGGDSPSVVSRTVTGIDLTVLLAVMNLGIFAWFTALVIRRTPRISMPVGHRPLAIDATTP